MKPTAFILLSFISHIAFGQQKLNKTLKQKMDSVIALDQKYRETLMLLMDPKTSNATAKRLSMTADQANSYYWKLQNRIDSSNVIFIERIFKRYGYPGKTLVGEPANEAAWNVIQHSPKIDKYLPLIKKAADGKELPYRLYAKMLDRQLSDHGKEQIYGTQAVCRPLKNGKNIGCYIWPIKDAARVNARRKKAGFDLTVEQNATGLDIDYKVIKISEVQ